MKRSDLARFLWYGTRLDAWAAKTSRHLGEQIPHFQSALEQNRLDEIEHGRLQHEMLIKLHEPVSVYPGYVREIGMSSVGPSPLWNAALLNFVERRSEVQFKLAWRLTRNGDLLQIAADEHRHVKVVREILRSLGSSRAKAAIDDVYTYLEVCDTACGSDDLPGLKALNGKILQEILESL